MRKIEYIEQQIAELSQVEFAELRAWVLERDAHGWDGQIAADASAGRFEELVTEAQTNYKAGRSREM